MPVLLVQVGVVHLVVAPQGPLEELADVVGEDGVEVPDGLILGLGDVLQHLQPGDQRLEGHLVVVLPAEEVVHLALPLESPEDQNRVPVAGAVAALLCLDDRLDLLEEVLEALEVAEGLSGAGVETDPDVQDDGDGGLAGEEVLDLAVGFEDDVLGDVEAVAAEAVDEEVADFADGFPGLVELLLLLEGVVDGFPEGVVADPFDLAGDGLEGLGDELVEVVVDAVDGEDGDEADGEHVDEVQDVFVSELLLEGDLVPEGELLVAVGEGRRLGYQQVPRDALEVPLVQELPPDFKVHDAEQVLLVLPVHLGDDPLPQLRVLHQRGGEFQRVLLAQEVLGDPPELPEQDHHDQFLHVGVLYLLIQPEVHLVLATHRRFSPLLFQIVDQLDKGENPHDPLQFYKAQQQRAHQVVLRGQDVLVLYHPRVEYQEQRAE